jgi:hypothetical protein
LTDDSQQVIQRSVIRSRKDQHGINRRVTFDPNLDPEVTLDVENQNLAHRTPIRFSEDEITIDRQHKQVRKARGPRGEQSVISVPETFQENPLLSATNEISNVDPSDDTHLRRSHRQSKPPSRFCNMVTIGIHYDGCFQPIRHGKNCNRSNLYVK